MSGEYTAGPWDTYDDSGPDYDKWVVGDAASVYGQICVVQSPENTAADARLIVQSPALLKACKWFMQQLEDGVLVRDISKDGESDWAMRMLKFTASLSDAHEAITKAEAGE